MPVLSRAPISLALLALPLIACGPAPEPSSTSPAGDNDVTEDGHADDHIDGDDHVDDPVDDGHGHDVLLWNPIDADQVELATTDRQLVYVNFTGVTVDDCDNYCSHAPSNRSFAIGAHFGQSSVTFGAYQGGSAARADIMNRLRTAFDDYQIEFTTSRPSSGPYTMLIISPSNVGPNHGVAPMNCNNSNANDITFVYKIGNSSTAWIAQAGAHELGHSFGLTHVTSSSAIMQWASSGNAFRNSNVDQARSNYQCFEGTVQNGPQMLTDALGAYMSEPEPYNGTFVDDDDSIFENSIEAIYAAGITVGCGGGDRPKFCPEKAVTRAQMVVFLKRALDLPNSSTNHFHDDNGAWYEAAANAAADAGITLGCGGGKFCGENDITRGQMAAFLARALDLPASSTDHFDDDDDSIFENAINAIADEGITQGCGGDNFCPDDAVTRGQMAAFLTRALDL